MQQDKTQKIVIDTQVIDKVGNNILVADEEAASRQEIAAILTAAAYNVTVAESVGETMEKLIDYTYDLFIVSSQLPGMSPLEIAKYCKKRHPMMEVITTAATPEVETAVKLIKEGVFDYISKPFKKNRLLDSVKTALNTQRQNVLKMITSSATRNGLIEKFSSIFPSFDMLETLGEGSSGVVLLVKKNGEKYALKILHSRTEMNNAVPHKKILERFSQEAEIMSRIQHPNIVRVYQCGVAENMNIPYILMEYVQGSSLTELIKNNKFTFQEKLEIVMEICQALATVHREGILHRDIKPGNILIDGKKIPKLTDFGISRILDTTPVSKHEMIGSPAYMSPESYDDACTVDQRSDIFSLGIVCYEFFTGKKPFHGSSVIKMMESIKNEKPKEPCKLNPEISKDFQYILAKMLHKEPQHRFQRVEEIIETVAGILSGDGIKKSNFFMQILQSAGGVWY